MTQLALGSSGQDVATLTCMHRVYLSRRDAKRTKDGWYAAVPCPDCGERRAVVSIAYTQREEP